MPIAASLPIPQIKLHKENEGKCSDEKIDYNSLEMLQK
jgi:hypothetical protein